jgi:hypothetical protein
MSGQAEREDDSDQPARPRRKRSHRLVKVAVLGGAVALLFNEDVRGRVLDALFGAEEEFDYSSVTEPPSPTTPPHGGSPSEPWVRSTPHDSGSFVEPDSAPEQEQDELDAPDSELDAPEPDLDARDGEPDARGDSEPNAPGSDEDAPEPELSAPEPEPDAADDEPDAADDEPELEVHRAADEPEAREPEPDAPDSQPDDAPDARDSELDAPIGDTNGGVVVIASEDVEATGAPLAEDAVRPASSVSPSPAAWHAAQAVEEEHDEPEVEAPPAEEPAAAARPPDPPRGWFTPSSTRVEPRQG